MLIGFNLVDDSKNIYIDPCSVLALEEDLFRNVTIVHMYHGSAKVFGKIQSVAKRLGLELKAQDELR